MQTDELWEGEPVKFAGKTYILPALNIAGLERLQGELVRLGELDPTAQLKVSLEALLSAFRRNYPDMTMDQLKDMVDLRNLRSLIDTVMATSGLVRTEISEGKAPAGSSRGSKS